MPQAIVKPEDLEMFSRQLKSFIEKTKVDIRTLNGQFNKVGETWRDQEHRKFSEEFVNTVKVIEKFIITSEEHIPFLIRKAQKARDYLNQR